ncbi:DUF72 domain-containing protein [Sphingobacterium sp. SG20118]|uniref:DUF72 domain-containing protein n=1 Tax=Sphingobacterium sp. SG20118 TaxID=3367156 RepID=UPI0037DFC77A
MKFGQVSNPKDIDFTLPPTAPDTLSLLKELQHKDNFAAYVGCAKWNKSDLKGFYPKGTKDELPYYSKQFNSIELNATFYNTPSKSQVETWKEKTTPDFKFCPKIPQSISHYSRLLNTDEKVKEFTDSIALFEEKLGMTFLQMHDNYKPKDIERLREFLIKFPKGIPLAVEVRNEEWFSNPATATSYYKLLEEFDMTNVLVDTAGRRDLLHMRLTTTSAFIRYVGANDPSDYPRLAEWVTVIKQWREAGLQNLYFFIHQNIEVESPLLAAYFIQKLNKELNLNLHIPTTNN